MSRELAPVGKNDHDDEIHPAFGMFSAHRVSAGPPGTVLFDSDIRHSHYVTVTISGATRKRDIGHDWIHSGNQIIEVAMSEAQWAAAISSMSTGGTPCTLTFKQGEGYLPGIPYAPRMAEQMGEVRDAAGKAVEKIRAAMEAYDAATTPKQKKDALSHLRAMIGNTEANVTYAAKKLTEYTEDVVQRARADIEAHVQAAAKQTGISPADLGNPLAITAGEDEA